MYLYETSEKKKTPLLWISAYVSLSLLLAGAVYITTPSGNQVHKKSVADIDDETIEDIIFPDLPEDYDPEPGDPADDWWEDWIDNILGDEGIADDIEDWADPYGMNDPGYVDDPTQDPEHDPGYVDPEIPEDALPEDFLPEDDFPEDGLPEDDLPENDLPEDNSPTDPFALPEDFD